MKLVGIGDLLIPGDFINKGFACFGDRGIEVVTVPWNLKDYEEYTKSQDYVEDIAKSKLGLLHDNEIVFKEKKK